MLEVAQLVTAAAKGFVSPKARSPAVHSLSVQEGTASPGQGRRRPQAKFNLHTEVPITPLTAAKTTVPPAVG